MISSTFGAAAGGSSGPSIINRLVDGLATVTPSSPSRKNIVEEQRKRTEERLARELAKLDNFKQVTLQRALLKSTTVIVEPETKPTEFEVALRVASRNHASFADLMRSVPPL